MGLLNKAAPWLAGKLKRAAAADPGATRIVYVRASDGARVDLSGKAWVGRTVFRQNPSEAGASIVFGDRDYLCPVADLTVNGEAFEPSKTDRVEETTDGVTRTYDVLAQNGEPAARYADPQRTIHRIHCVEHLNEAAE